MKKIALIALAFSLSVLTASAQQTFEYPAENPIFSITYPEGWDVEPSSDTISASVGDGAVSTVLMAVEGNNIESAIDGAQAGIEEIFPTVKMDDEVQQATLNNLEAILINGVGENDEAKVNFTCAIFTPDGETFFMLFLFSPDGIGDEYVEQINSLLKSITR